MEIQECGVYSLLVLIWPSFSNGNKKMKVDSSFPVHQPFSSRIWSLHYIMFGVFFDKVLHQHWLVWINYPSPSWNCESIGGRNEILWSWLILNTVCLPHRKYHHYSVAPGKKKIFPAWRCWRVKQREGTNMSTRAELKGSGICWIHALLGLKATGAIHIVIMLDVPCWDNGISARTERVPKLCFSSVLRAEYAVPLVWVKLVDKDAQTALWGCSRAGFLTGVPGLGLFSIWICEDSGKFSWGRTQQHKWRCRLSLQTHCSWHMLGLPLVCGGYPARELCPGTGCSLPISQVLFVGQITN